MATPTIAIPGNSEPVQPRKRARSIKPQAIQNAILVKAAQGLNKSQIAQDLQIHTQTVRNVLSMSDISQHVAELRSDIVTQGDLRKSVKVIRTKLDKGSESAALAMLRGFNVLQSGNQMTVNVQNNGAMTWMQINATKQDEEDRVRTEQNAANNSPIDPQPSK